MCRACHLGSTTSMEYCHVEFVWSKFDSAAATNPDGETARPVNVALR